MTGKVPQYEKTIWVEFNYLALLVWDIHFTWMAHNIIVIFLYDKKLIYFRGKQTELF